MSSTLKDSNQPEVSQATKVRLSAVSTILLLFLVLLILLLIAAATERTDIIKFSAIMTESATLLG
jgi:hypothetical protein